MDRRHFLGLSAISIPLLGKKHHMPVPGGVRTITPVNTTVNNTPQQIWSGGTGIDPLIINNDTNNPMYIGAKRDVLRQDVTSCIPVAPLSNQVWGDVDVWAFAPVPVNCLVVPGATQFNFSPAQIAQQLQPNILAQNVTTSAAGGGTFPITPIFTGRIWGWSLTQAFNSDSTFTGDAGCTGELVTSVSVKILANQSIFVAGASQQSNSVDNLALSSPIPVNNERVNLITQAIAAHTNQTVTGIIYYSSP